MRVVQFPKPTAAPRIQPPGLLPIAPIRHNHNLGKPGRIAPQIAPPPLATAVITALAPR